MLVHLCVFRSFRKLLVIMEVQNVSGIPVIALSPVKKKVMGSLLLVKEDSGVAFREHLEQWSIIQQRLTLHYEGTKPICYTPL